MDADGQYSRKRQRRASKAAVVFMLLSAVFFLPPVASNAQIPVPETVTVVTDVESWYYVSDDTTPPPAPLPELPVPEPVNPYGENTLHVSITGGQEETRTYVVLDTAELPAIFELVEGTLTLPIDPGGVTVNPETSRVQVCLADAPPESQEGSFEEPPEVDCATKAPATYEEEPFPHLVADITEFGPDLSFSGLAIMPSDRAKEQSDTWHVTFYGKKNETEGARPITAQLEILESDPLDFIDPTDDFDTGGESSEPPPDFGSTSGESGGFDFDTSTGPSLGTDTAPDAGTEETADEPTEATAPVAAPEFDLTSEETPPAYTIVWALPLFLLALASYFSSALTREIVLSRDTRLPR